MIRCLSISREDSSVARGVVKSVPHLPVEGCDTDAIADFPVVESLLYVCGRRVVHCDITASYTYQSWSFSPTDTTAVVQATWVSFVGCEESWLAILVNPELLALYSGDGSQVELALPFEAESIWAFMNGLFVQPLASNIVSSRRTAAAVERFPLSLSHPLDELKPIKFVCRDAGYMCSCHERFMYVDSRWAVTYGGAHSFWAVERSNLLESHRYDNMAPQPRFGKHVDSYASPQTDKSTSRVCLDATALEIDAVPTMAELVVDFTLSRAQVLKPSGAARKVFVSTNILGVQLLCLLVDRTLTAFVGLMQAAFELSDCLDAAPLASMGDSAVNDLIVLRDSDRTLHVYRGDLCITSLAPLRADSYNQFNSPLRSPQPHEHVWSNIADILSPLQTESTSIGSLSHAVGSRVSLNLITDENSTSTRPGVHCSVRIEVSLRSSHHAVEACLAALDAVTLPAVSIAFRDAVLKMDRDGWEAFRNVLNVVAAPTKDELEEEGESDPWCELLSSDYHLQAAVNLQRRAYPCLDLPSRSARYKRTRDPSLPGSLQQAVRGIRERADLNCILSALHLVYEEWKLNVMTWSSVRPLGRLLAAVCKDEARVQRYRRDVIGCDSHAPSQVLPPLQSDVHEWFSTVLKHGRSPYELQTLPACLPNGVVSPGVRVRQLASIGLCLDHENGSSPADTAHVQNGRIALAHTIVQALIRSNVCAGELSTWPPGFVLPLQDALAVARQQPAHGWSAESYRLTGRQDLASLYEHLHTPGTERWQPTRGTSRRESPPMLSSSVNCYHRLKMGVGESQPILRSQPYRNTNEVTTVRGHAMTDQSLAGEDDEDRDGLGSDGSTLMNASSPLALGIGVTVKDVCHFLQSSQPIELHVVRPPELSDHEYEKKKQEKLLSACLRCCAAPCGRAMLTLGSLSLTSTLIETIPMPKVSLSGRIPPSSAIVALDAMSVEMLGSWIHFHNGVAAGLRLFSPEVINPMARYQFNVAVSNGNPISRTWIAYNRPETPSAEHGGLLLALGLQRMLHNLTMTDVYEYLTLSHDPTTVGILLGMAASRVGSADAVVSKMLCLHIPALLPQPFAEMDVSSAAQAAALAGIGLLYRGTAHRLMAEFLLSEIAKGNPGDQSRDREAYVLTAGLALGMVILGMGASHEVAGLGDLHISQRLHRAIVGARGKHKLRDVRVTEHRGSLRNSAFSDIHNETSSLTSTSVRSNSTSQCYHLNSKSANSEIGIHVRGFRVKEGDLVNTTVSAPGATLALGLFFLQTNNLSAAAQIDLPDTHVLLNGLRPDFLLLRIIARNLILWDSILASTEWIENQIPDFVRVSMVALRNTLESSKRSANEHRLNCLDWESAKHAHAHVLAGACFAVGLKFAGTGCSEASKTIRYYLNHFKILRDAFCCCPENECTSASVTDVSFTLPTFGAAACDESARTNLRNAESVAGRTSSVILSLSATKSDALALRPDRPTVEMALGVVVIALGMVMAGTGDIQSLHLMRDLRRRVDKGTTFGTHQAIHAAIGLLFLGAGKASLSRSKEAVAALVCAFYPRYPHTAGDNQYHLQPLRHFWVLAVSWRDLHAVDVSTGERVRVPLQIALKPHVDWAPPHTILNVTAPCLAPPIEDVRWIRSASERYYYIDLDLCDVQRLREVEHLKLFVKRRSGVASSSQDLLPFGSRPVGDDDDAKRSLTFSAWARSGRLGSHAIPCADLISLYTDDPVTLMFARHFCDALPFPPAAIYGQVPPLGIMPCGDTASRNAQFIYECVTVDREHILPTYVQLQYYAHQLRLSANSLHAWALRLMLDYVSGQLRERLTAHWLLRPSFVESVRVYLDRTLLGGTEEFQLNLAFEQRLNGCRSILEGVLAATFVL
mmetsp:Transcript_6433/g.19518  ORF Transcript_6433/g.19518 Transcript_6433/m.19518 type:complete len:1862 (-) Transcript_6433:388-5973(-)